MLKQSIHFRRNLALLAVCLHMVVAAVGGRFCLWTAPIPASDACVSLCCGEEDASLPESVGVEIDLAQSPLIPAGADCCLEMVTDNFATTLGVSSLRDSGGSLPAVILSFSRTGISISRFEARGPRAALPPPSMPMIRSTILRL